MMRLQPSTLPWKRDPSAPLSDADGGALGSATSVAERALRALSTAKLAIAGERTVLQAGFRQVVISIANLPLELDSEEKIRGVLSMFGEIVRVAIIRNPAGLSKNFAIVEFAVPSAAAEVRKAQELLPWSFLTRLVSCTISQTLGGSLVSLLRRCPPQRHLHRQLRLPRAPDRRRAHGAA
jgi:hypothetical protein